MRELVEQGIEIDGKRYDLVLDTGARKHGDFLTWSERRRVRLSHQYFQYYWSQ